MAEPTNTPRRVRVERGIYRRATGVLEVGFKDETGRQRWRTVDGGVLAARKLRDDLTARRARGESVAPQPKLRFGEAADSWLGGPVLDLRETTQAKYRAIVTEHLRLRFEARRLDAVTPRTISRGSFAICGATARVRRRSRLSSAPWARSTSSPRDGSDGRARSPRR